MSRSGRKGQERRVGEKRGSNPPMALGTSLPWVIAGILVVVLIGIWAGVGPAGASHHPDPRPGLTGATVVPASQYAHYPRVSAVYQQAAEIPGILDGLYCYCDCSRHSGHRSLLSCFESDHGAACDICLTEATVAHRMNQEGRSLDEIRNAIDEFYGR